MAHLPPHAPVLIVKLAVVAAFLIAYQAPLRVIVLVLFASLSTSLQVVAMTAPNDGPSPQGREASHLVVGASVIVIGAVLLNIVLQVSQVAGIVGAAVILGVQWVVIRSLGRANARDA